MKFLGRFLPHLSLALALGLIVLVVLDGYNPMMAFLTSRPSKIFMLAVCVSSVLVSLVCIVRDRRE